MRAGLWIGLLAGCPVLTDEDLARRGFDGDGDGYDALEVSGSDCDDGDDRVYPGAPDRADDTVDQDCDGADGVDADGDGRADLASGGDDCDDADPTVAPGRAEIWYDGVDQDCDGGSDYDQDGDGHDLAGSAGPVPDDCDDTDPALHPGAVDDPDDTIDEDCDGCGDGVASDGEACWGPAESVETGSEDTPVYVGDLDADGWIDIVSGGVTEEGLEVAWGTGPAAWAEPTHVEVGVTGLVYALAVADLDGDGENDLAFASDLANVGRLHTALGAGRRFTATFTEELPEGVRVHQLWAMPADDRSGPYVVAHAGDEGLLAWIGNEDGSLTAVPDATPLPSSAVVSGVIDLDADGRFEIVGVAATGTFAATIEAGAWTSEALTLEQEDACMGPPTVLVGAMQPSPWAGGRIHAPFDLDGALGADLPAVAQDDCEGVYALGTLMRTGASSWTAVWSAEVEMGGLFTSGFVDVWGTGDPGWLVARLVEGGGGWQLELTALRAEPDGAFAPATPYTLLTDLEGGVEPVFADVDADGDVDVLWFYKGALGLSRQVQ